MEMIHNRGKMSQGRLFQDYPTYKMAKWYCFTCGFSVVPLKFKSKQRLFSGTHFQTWFPCEEHLRKWFCTKQPYNVAIVPGDVSGNLVIIDFDDFAVYQVWSSLVPGATDLPLVRSSRGVHVYVRLRTLPVNGKGRFEGMVFGDVLSRGAVTAPPSIHPSGHLYQWAGNPAAVPLFSCLADFGLERVISDQASSDRKPLTMTEFRRASGIHHPAAYVQAALVGEQRRLLDLPEGQRNAGLYRAALKLSKYLTVVSESELLTALETVAQQMGLERREISTTIRSGLQRGVENGVLTL